MKTRPLIGISIYRNEPIDVRDEPGFNYCLTEAYPNMISRAGGIPVLLPYSFDAWDALDGVLLSGGDDIAPALAGNENDPGEAKCVDPARDAVELALFRGAGACGLPILGICRGCQLINCALGGTLVRDLHAAGIAEEHRVEPFGIEGLHPVRAERGSLAERLLAGHAGVCSCHHQAVKTLGRGLRATAWSPAGVIEAFEHENGRILGIQSHPEQMDWLAPFRWLVELAGADGGR